jgi:uncharacterized protein (UPF0332 family)
MTPEQSALLRKSQDSIEASKILKNSGYCDFAVSRAYYAMFYVAEAFLLEDSLSFSKHLAVISAFGERFAKLSRVPQEFHRYLIEAENSRNVGDYDTGQELSEDEAYIQIERADKFLAIAKQLLGDFPSK